MNTQHLLASDSKDIEQAKDILASGELVAIPTETVYGLAADASNPEAVKKIFAAKGRPANHPLIVHIGEVEQLSEWAKDIPQEAYTIAKAYWPGPVTVLLNKADQATPVVTGGLDTIGIRMPAHEVFATLLKSSGMAVAAPSANPYKKLSPTSAEHVLNSLGGRIAAVLDGGNCAHGLESTIIDLTQKPFRILRSGPVTAAQLSETLGEEVLSPKAHTVAVPGNVTSHYQPNTRVRLVDLAEIENAEGSNIACLHISAIENQSFKSKQMPSDVADYSHDLYRALDEADKWGCEEIWVEHPPISDEWLAVHDRLSRAQSKL
ncbi:L-threonylcarbamoyladenylate synthase [Vibrio tubiashii]|uniref:Threonylcarbamoyl-AMP synthase n=1 Tax=Vibrio tubiashii ATCC 19109 TaxID=1051646 RepID=F9T4H2_9VIBR|nr:L-threonylcarbamoyladenylate synthase [Vibrio tubiashii]AIW13303.1 translation factor Sua5 [Vibrio tubiashii ATCC 19109]EGU56083.1 putative translation factor [Vibrio tubiashii ATCC 19109]EIF04295.1 translation factor [Vibrio tubiashii NCIMB 1337 = ATCC 19106]MCG9579065.1 threonylcarbamoyl-AMP synthase [Vibrio tubiashii]WCP67814.1 L-threonylcarbamoyladenylate synthase [Vibrio tubiashii]